MKAFTHILILLTTSLALVSCSVTRNSNPTTRPDLSKYKYVYITPTYEKTSLTSSTYGDIDGLFGSASTRSVIPSEVIAGSFMKHGFVRIPQLNDDLKAQTIVVNYGESGRKFYGIGYSIEVTIQLIDAATYELICTSSAEGLGETETDDIRKATLKCLAAIFQ